VVTEKQLAAIDPERGRDATAEDAMQATAQTVVVAPREDASTLLQKMEADDLWHLPVVADNRVVGVVSKDSLLRIIANRLVRRPGFAGQT
jgi:predicted transcriptional regulator